MSDVNFVIYEVVTTYIDCTFSDAILELFKYFQIVHFCMFFIYLYNLIH